MKSLLPQELLIDYLQKGNIDIQLIKQCQKKLIQQKDGKLQQMNNLLQNINKASKICSQNQWQYQNLLQFRTYHQAIELQQPQNFSQIVNKQKQLSKIFTQIIENANAFGLQQNFVKMAHDINQNIIIIQKIANIKQQFQTFQNQNKMQRRYHFLSSIKKQLNQIYGKDFQAQMKQSLIKNDAIKLQIQCYYELIFSSLKMQFSDERFISKDIDMINNQVHKYIEMINLIPHQDFKQILFNRADNCKIELRNFIEVIFDLKQQTYVQEYGKNHKQLIVRNYAESQDFEKDIDVLQQQMEKNQLDDVIKQEVSYQLKKQIPPKNYEFLMEKINEIKRQNGLMEDYAVDLEKDEDLNDKILERVLMVKFKAQFATQYLLQKYRKLRHDVEEQELKQQSKENWEETLEQLPNFNSKLDKQIPWEDLAQIYHGIRNFETKIFNMNHLMNIQNDLYDDLQLRIKVAKKKFEPYLKKYLKRNNYINEIFNIQKLKNEKQEWENQIELFSKMTDVQMAEYIFKEGQNRHPEEFPNSLKELEQGKTYFMKACGHRNQFYQVIQKIYRRAMLAHEKLKKITPVFERAQILVQKGLPILKREKFNWEILLESKINKPLEKQNEIELLEISEGIRTLEFIGFSIETTDLQIQLLSQAYISRQIFSQLLEINSQL